jgi:hypothetical protein
MHAKARAASFIFVNQIKYCAQLKHNAFEPGDVRGNGCEVGEETCVPTISLARPDRYPLNIQIAGNAIGENGRRNFLAGLFLFGHLIALRSGIADHSLGKSANY